MSHGRGARRDDRSHPLVVAQRPFHELARKVGASSTPRGATSLAKWRTARMDQDGSNSCEAHAASLAIYERHAVLGKPLPFVPSPLALWSDAILLETSPTPTPGELAMINTGVMTVSMMIAIGQGVRPMGTLAPGRYSDVVAGPVAPGLDQLTTAAMVPQVGEYRIDDSSPSWTELAAIAIDNGIPVLVALDVGPAYDAWVPSMPPIDAAEAPGTSGGHAIVLDAYSTSSSGRVFESPGSYGNDYADDGVWLFTARGLELRAFDVYPMEVG